MKRKISDTIESLDIDEKKPCGSLSLLEDKIEQKIILNVGGVKYETYRSTLTSYPNTLLGTMMNSPMSKDRTEFFFDRDGELFKYILNYYRNGFVDMPTNIGTSNIMAEFNYWQIPLTVETERIAKTFMITRDFLQRNSRKNLHNNRPKYIKEIIRDTAHSLDFHSKGCYYNDNKIKRLKAFLEQCQSKLIDTEKIVFDDHTFDSDRKDVNKKINEYKKSLDDQIRYLQNQKQIIETIENALDGCKTTDLNLIPNDIGMNWDLTYLRKALNDRKPLCENDCPYSCHCKPIKFFSEGNTAFIMLENIYSKKPSFEELIGYDREQYLLWKSIVGESIEIKEIGVRHHRSRSEIGSYDIFSENIIDTHILKMHFSCLNAVQMTKSNNFIKSDGIHDIYRSYYMKISYKEEGEKSIRELMKELVKNEK